jgi:DNA-binding response OmpR family regulator
MTCVLVIGDDSWIQWMIADDLADRGYAILTARNEADAVRCVAEVRPDVIVLDMMLAPASGWGFVDRFQAGYGGQIIPIIVVSATRNPATASVGLTNVQRCIAKPFDIEELARAVAELSRHEPALTPA